MVSSPPLWQGVYYGISAGYGWGESAGVSPEGFAASVTAGYNHQVGPLVIGIEGDFGYINGEDSAAGGLFRSELGPLWATARGRAGLAFGRALLYGTGGAAFAQTDVTIAGDSNDDWRTGWVAGGGLEWALGSRTSAKVEYLHMDFGQNSELAGFAFDEKIDLVRLGLNFRF
ncbi:MAG TPA: outer membrane beta-barrel protein [Hyphomicrobiaceae bacterium]|nr:outer membrane beta-barrel protein [Hyphomicrobiaceae bacterium]